MTIDDDRRPQDPVNTILRLIGTQNFQQELEMPGSRTVMGLDRTLKRIGNNERERLVVGILGNVAKASKDQSDISSSQRWIATANEILLRVSETGITPLSWVSINDFYASTVTKQGESQNFSASVNPLLNVGREIAPYIGAAHAENDSWPGSVIQAWNTVREKFPIGSSRRSVTSQIEQVRIALGLTYLEEQYYHTYKNVNAFAGPVFNYYIAHPDASVVDVAGVIERQQPEDINGLRAKQRQLLVINFNRPSDELESTGGLNTKIRGRMQAFLRDKGLLPPRQERNGRTIYRKNSE